MGSKAGGGYHFTIPRAEEVTEAGMAIPPTIDTATAINFQPTGGGKAAIIGDFVMTADEVNPVDPGPAGAQHQGQSPTQSHAV